MHAEARICSYFRVLTKSFPKRGYSAVACLVYIWYLRLQCVNNSLIILHTCSCRTGGKLGANPRARKRLRQLGAAKKGKGAMPERVSHQLADRNFFSAHETKIKNASLMRIASWNVLRRALIWDRLDTQTDQNYVPTTWSCFRVHEYCWNH